MAQAFISCCTMSSCGFTNHIHSNWSFSAIPQSAVAIHIYMYEADFHLCDVWLFTAKRILGFTRNVQCT